MRVSKQTDQIRQCLCLLWLRLCQIIKYSNIWLQPKSTRIFEHDLCIWIGNFPHFVHKIWANKILHAKFYINMYSFWYSDQIWASKQHAFALNTSFLGLMILKRGILLHRKHNILWSNIWIFGWNWPYLVENIWKRPL